MLLTAEITEKTIGPKHLYKDLSLSILEGEKIAFIGRNGAGKTTLLKLMCGEDTEYTGEITIKKEATIVITQQEHFMLEHASALEYILTSVPHYWDLKKVLESSQSMGSDMQKIATFTEAVSRFAELGYYDIEDAIITTLARYRIGIDKAFLPLQSLSGGEKRFVELVKVMFAKADLALIDEPTNHMDYIGKSDFITWLQKTPCAVLVVTHDRDVLKEVDRIIELKDLAISSYPGNYEAYIKQNSIASISAIGSYEESERRLKSLKKQIITAREKKLKARGAKPAIRARKLEERLKRQYTAMEENMKKPSIWIDTESMRSIGEEVIQKYDTYKDKNIRIHLSRTKEYKRKLLSIQDLSLGYHTPLFEDISFSLAHGERMQLRGRNGTGKTTIVKAIIAKTHGEAPASRTYTGDIILDPQLHIGVYEQEIDKKYLSQTLAEAIMNIYFERNIPINNEGINKILKDYLFHPQIDKDLEMIKLSGGQKARFQLISLLAGEPNLLILDEPTNHLDLPSIEELEKALIQYQGAILYISHDSYFIEAIKAEVVEIGVAN